MKTKIIIPGCLISILIIGLLNPCFAQSRRGTTTANFLEISMGTGSAMGDANVAITNDLMSIYWNPAGLAFMNKSEAKFSNQPYFLDSGIQFVGVGIVVRRVATFALGITHMGFGETEVTTLTDPEGTGEKYTANDYAISFSIGRRLTNWFAFGATGKYIASQIWHMNASGAALDLGVLINTDFFSSKGRGTDGLNIGMSISNYGGGFSYDGIDLYRPIDIDVNAGGNYAGASGKFHTKKWEFPFIFRIGFSIKRYITSVQDLIIAVDALHPNNNSESINIGGQYHIDIPGVGDFYLRGGYKGIGDPKSIFGFTYGAGILYNIGPYITTKIDVGYKTISDLGNVLIYEFSVLF